MNRTVSPADIKIIAHRANGFRKRENTAAAFRAAAAAPIDGVELDVWVTRDGVPVIHHDPMVVTPRLGRPRHITGLNARQLPGHIPDLAETLDSLNVLPWINIELKRSNARLDPVYAHLNHPKLCTSSFHWPMLKAVRRRLPDADLALLLEETTPLGFALVRARELGCTAIHLSLRQLYPAWIASIREAGFLIRTYTANTPAHWRLCTNSGVDAIMTDRPLALKRWLTKHFDIQSPD